MRRFACHAMAATIGLLISFFMIALLDRRPPLRIEPGAHIDPDPVKIGGTITLTWGVTVDRNCAGEVISRLIDSTGRIYEYDRGPATYKDMTRPFPQYYTKNIALPTVMPLGKTQYDSIIARWCNPIQQYLWPMVEHTQPVWFEIAP